MGRRHRSRIAGFERDVVREWFGFDKVQSAADIGAGCADDPLRGVNGREVVAHKR